MNEEKLEALKLQILEMKNDISYPLWCDFIDWIIDEFDYNFYE